MEVLFFRRTDPWKYATSVYEANRLEAMKVAIEGQRYGRSLEVGCGEGLFTKHLLEVSDSVTCLDLSLTAIRRTRKAVENCGKELELIHGNFRNWQPSKGNYDLIVLGDILYYLEAPTKLKKWCYGTAQEQLPQAFGRVLSWMKPGGQLLLCHGYGKSHEKTRLESYRDLFMTLGTQLIEEKVGEPSDKGPTRFLLQWLIKAPPRLSVFLTAVSAELCLIPTGVF